MSLFSRRGGTLHLPLRSVVTDRVTGGPTRGDLNAEEEREYVCNRETDAVMGERGGEERGRRPGQSQEGIQQRWEG